MKQRGVARRQPCRKIHHTPYFAMSESIFCLFYFFKDLVWLVVWGPEPLRVSNDGIAELIQWCDKSQVGHCRLYADLAVETDKLQVALSCDLSCDLSCV